LDAHRKINREPATASGIDEEESEKTSLLNDLCRYMMISKKISRTDKRPSRLMLLRMNLEEL
jgi:hypothetical protein